jgi:hypothetical protein
MYLFELLNQYAANVSMVVVGFFEVYTIAYIYGLFLIKIYIWKCDKFFKDLIDL